MKIKKDSKNADYYLVIDSKQFEAEINFEYIEEIEELEDDRLGITYLAPSEHAGKGGLQRVTEQFECFEIDTIIKLYHKIKSQIVTQTKSKAQIE